MADVNIRLGLTADAAGTVDAITATYDPAPTLFDRLTLFFRASGANTSTTPTFNPNSLGAKTIVKKGNQALVAGDITGQHFVALVQYNSTLDKWVLLNPGIDLSDTIWEQNGQAVNLQDITDTLELGGDTNSAGLAPLGIYTEQGLIGLLIGDFSAEWMSITHDASGFGFISVVDMVFNSTVKASTPAAGTNSTILATTEYVDRVNVQSVVSSATVTPDSVNDVVVITAQAVGLTLANPTGTWQQGQALAVRIKDNGTSRTIAYGAGYRAIGTTLPTATTASKTIYLFIVYNSTDSKWDVTGVSEEA